MAKNNKNKNQAATPKASTPAPAIDVLKSVSVDAKAGGEVPVSSPPATPIQEPAQVVKPVVAQEKPATYREHQASWESKAERAAKAAPSVGAQPDRKLPSKFRKFANLKEKK